MEFSMNWESLHTIFDIAPDRHIRNIDLWCKSQVCRTLNTWWRLFGYYQDSTHVYIQVGCVGCCTSWIKYFMSWNFDVVIICSNVKYNIINSRYKRFSPAFICPQTLVKGNAILENVGGRALKGDFRWKVFRVACT